MKKSAFTLIELAIVLVIIGALIVGISQGGSMINSARLSGARSYTANSPVPEVEGLIAWYETSTKNSFLQNQTTNDSQLSSWFDISPASIIDQKNTLTKTASSAVTYHVNGINSIPSVLFDSSEKFGLSNFYQGSLRQVTLFLVIRPESIPSQDIVIPFDSATSNDRFSLTITENKLTLNAGNNSSSSATNQANFQEGSDYIIAAYFNLDSSLGYVNQALSIIGGSTLSIGTNLLNGLSIGSDRNGGSGFTGMISEIIIFNKPLKRNDRIDIMRYLSKKYKIAVSEI